MPSALNRIWIAVKWNRLGRAAPVDGPGRIVALWEMPPSGQEISRPAACENSREGCRVAALTPAPPVLDSGKQVFFAVCLPRR